MTIAASAPTDDDTMTFEGAVCCFMQHTCVILTAFRSNYTLEKNIAG